MNYLIVDYNSVFVAKNDVAIIKAKIQGIELQKPMLSTWYIHNQFAALSYCQQVLNLLIENFADGFSKIEAYKHKLTDEFLRDYCFELEHNNPRAQFRSKLWKQK